MADHEKQSQNQMDSEHADSDAKMQSKPGGSRPVLDPVKGLREMLDACEEYSIAYQFINGITTKERAEEVKLLKKKCLADRYEKHMSDEEIARDLGLHEVEVRILLDE